MSLEEDQLVLPLVKQPAFGQHRRGEDDNDARFSPAQAAANEGIVFIGTPLLPWALRMGGLPR